MKQAYLTNLCVFFTPSHHFYNIDRYLSIHSSSFASAYPAAVGTDYRLVDFASRIDASRLIKSTSAYLVDSNVDYYDGSIGYSLLAEKPTQLIAGLCADDTCGMTSSTATPKAVFPTDFNAIQACMADPSTVVNPSPRLYSYDTLRSKSPGCYPIVATIDYTTFNGASSYCNNPEASVSVSRRSW